MNSILIIDDEIENLKALERTLKGQFNVTHSTSPRQGLDLLKAADFSVVISDQKMPEVSGTDFLAKAAQIAPLSTRIILTAFPDTQSVMEAVNRAEIYRYITKPWDNQELIGIVQQAARHHDLLKENEKLLRSLQDLKSNLERTVAERTLELKEANERLSELAMTDPLTKTLNRRPFFAKLSEEIERSKRHRRPIAIAMLDLDFFKVFNDMEGHLAGDEALKKVVQILASNLRKSDSLCRYGGEEFLILFPETHLASGEEICERLRIQVERNSFQGEHKQAYLTLSIGLASYPNHAEDAEALIQAADKALYKAKDTGRNRVVVYDESIS
ncbi:MAG: diguanylate cyclase [Deltaproteobacteria bacterium]|nr:diguanylate cyclase [Deltaproteobacteria bacterium]MBI3293400.1 diguanylate cyclase [Deltaproteobacteria bacterium]